jgi:hypothetical protein
LNKEKTTAIYECRIIPKCSIYIRENIYWGVLQMKKKSIIKNEHGQTIKSLKKFKRGLKDSRKIDRINVIILAFRGKNRLEIAKILGFNNQTVGEYVKKYNEGGLEELLTIGEGTWTYSENHSRHSGCREGNREFTGINNMSSISNNAKTLGDR